MFTNYTVASNHILAYKDKPVRAVKTPNVGGSMSVRRFLLMHFTAGRNAESSINWLCNPSSKVSAHLVIARSGEVIQLAPFNVITWHAGRSQWKWNGELYQGLNSCSIGIEFDNYGRLSRKNGQWVTWFGAPVPDKEVAESVHKHGGPKSGWHTYTDDQISSGMEVAAALIKRYNLDEVIGHDDVSPGRKDDPGPLFPMARFKSLHSLIRKKA